MFSPCAKFPYITMPPTYEKQQASTSRDGVICEAILYCYLYYIINPTFLVKHGPRRPVVLYMGI